MKSAASALLSHWTIDRRSYRLIVCLIAVAISAVWMNRAALLDIIAIVALLTLYLTVVAVTIARLKEAGWSRLWALWFLTPGQMTVDLLSIQWNGHTWHLLNITTLLRILPIVIGLVVRSSVPRDPKTLPEFA